MSSNSNTAKERSTKSENQAFGERQGTACVPARRQVRENRASWVLTSANIFLFDCFRMRVGFAAVRLAAAAIRSPCVFQANPPEKARQISSGGGLGNGPARDQPPRPPSRERCRAPIPFRNQPWACRCCCRKPPQQHRVQAHRLTGGGCDGKLLTEVAARGAVRDGTGL